MPKQTATEIMDKIVAAPTLDELMRRLKPLSDEEYKSLVARLREERPLYIAKQAARKEKTDEED